MFKEIADIKTSDQLKLPVPEVEYETVVLKPTEQQKEIVESLGERAEVVRNGGVDASVDNMLKITNDGRKLALDQRLVNELLPDNPESKISVCAEKSYEIWKDTAAQKSAQLIFCDLSTPKGDGSFNVYDDLKRKLMEKGVPEKEIAFIHDANTEAKKTELFGKVKSGQVRFLIGSTAKMGAGTNVRATCYPTVRLVLLSGDWINTSLPGRLRKIMTNAQMISLGGATEGGIWSIYHEIDEIEERPTILYGKALLGQWMGVVDEELRICPEYVSGQIAIGGYSLAEGYLGDTTLTKEKFVYVEEEKNRIYLTGDNGRYVENGDIEFLGRLDNQVKINGHRIEIAEIENAIRGMQNIEDCCVVYNQSIGKGVLIAFIKNKISSISYTKEEYRKQLAFFLPPAMIPSEFVNVERFPLSTNGKIDRKGLAESIQKNIKVKHNAKATLISQKKEYVELAKSIKKIVCSISGNDYIDYEDNLLENGLDSLLLSQISGRIVSDIQEAQGMRFDEILRASLTMPTIMGIAQYISDCKNPSKNQMHSNAGNQTRNSYTVVYIFGDNENEIRDVLIEKLSASNISCKRVGGQEIIERCHEDISVKKKYIIAFSEMASLCITKASELLGENIIINRIFLINPSKAKESDLYLGDISIIDGNSVAIKSWEKAVLGNVREFESNSNDIFDIIMRELENDK